MNGLMCFRDPEDYPSRDRPQRSQFNHYYQINRIDIHYAPGIQQTPTYITVARVRSNELIFLKKRNERSIKPKRQLNFILIADVRYVGRESNPQPWSLVMPNDARWSDNPSYEQEMLRMFMNGVITYSELIKLYGIGVIPTKILFQ